MRRCPQLFLSIRAGLITSGFAFVFLGGCSPGLRAILETGQHAVTGKSGTADVKLDPRFQYIRATVAGRAAYLALGNEEAGQGAPLRVWYSADKEVLKFQDGRLAGASGVPVEWRHVRINDAPDWARTASAEGGVKWRRKRDVMPGYQSGVQDDLLVRRISPPRSSAIRDLDAGVLVWFEERMISTTGGELLPAARYGVDMRGGRAEVVYGEQCLSKAICFTWQQWPPAGR